MSLVPSTFGRGHETHLAGAHTLRRVPRPAVLEHVGSDLHDLPLGRGNGRNEGLSAPPQFQCKVRSFATHAGLRKTSGRVHGVPSHRSAQQGVFGSDEGRRAFSLLHLPCAECTVGRARHLDLRNLPPTRQPSARRWRYRCIRRELRTRSARPGTRGVRRVPRRSSRSRPWSAGHPSVRPAAPFHWARGVLRAVSQRQSCIRRRRLHGLQPLPSGQRLEVLSFGTLPWLLGRPRISRSGDEEHATRRPRRRGR